MSIEVDGTSERYPTSVAFNASNGRVYMVSGSRVEL